MDIKHVLSQNLPQPPYLVQRADSDGSLREQPPAGAGASVIEHEGGLCEIGYRGSGFVFDNELPRHAVHLEPFAIDARPVTCGEWIAIHRGRRVRPARAVAVGRLGHLPGRALGRTSLLVRERRQLVVLHARRPPAGQA